MPQPWLGNPIFFPAPRIKVISRDLIPPVLLPPTPKEAPRGRARRREVTGKWTLLRPHVPMAPRIIPPPCMTPAEKVIHSACLMFGLMRMDLLGAGRSALHVGARTYISVRLRTELGLSLLQIGRLLNRDHTSILNLLRKADGVPVTVRNGVACRRKRGMEAAP